MTSIKFIKCASIYCVVMKERPGLKPFNFLLKLPNYFKPSFKYFHIHSIDKMMFIIFLFFTVIVRISHTQKNTPLTVEKKINQIVNTWIFDVLPSVLYIKTMRIEETIYSNWILFLKWEMEFDVHCVSL